MKHAKKLGRLVIINVSGRGDKDVTQVAEILKMKVMT
jgi:tryptophan synthase beta subunit